MDIEKLILDAASRGASDIHLTVGLPAVLRIDGALTDLDSGVLTQVELEEATLALAGERELDELRRRVNNCGSTAELSELVRRFRDEVSD